MVQLLKIGRAWRILGIWLALMGVFLPRLHAQSLVFDTALPAGTNLGAESWLGALATDAQGNVYVGGYFAGTIGFGSQQFKANHSQHNSFVAKYNADGDLLWARQVDPDSYQRIQALAVDAAGNVYVGGDYAGSVQFGTQTLVAQNSTPGATGDIFVAKLDAAGAWQWAVSAGGSDFDRCSNLAVGPSGEVVASGEFGSPTASFGAYQLPNLNPAAAPTINSLDIFVARLSPAGTWLGAVRAGSMSSDVAYGMAVDAAGATYVCGTLQRGPAQFGALTLASSSQTAYVAKLSAAGSWEWATGLGGPGSLYGLALDTSGRPYVAGYFSGPSLTLGATTLPNADPGSADILVAALTIDGRWRWASSAGSTNTDLVSDLAVAPSGQLNVAGQFYSRQLTLGPSSLTNHSDVGNGEAFVAQLDANGAWLAGLTPVGTGEKDARRVVTGADGTTYVAGTYWGAQAQFGAATLAGIGVFPTCFLAHVADANALPLLSALNPGSATPGQQVTVQGANFVDVRSVRFNGVAAAFQVQSSQQLTATVPAGAAAGLVRVRTGAGSAISQLAFTSTTLAAVPPAAADLVQLWPNPVATAGVLHLQLPTGTAPGASTRVEVHNTLGQLVASTEFRGLAHTWPLQLPTGLYQLVLRPTGQPSTRQALTVAD